VLWTIVPPVFMSLLLSLSDWNHVRRSHYSTYATVCTFSILRVLMFVLYAFKPIVVYPLLFVHGLAIIIVNKNHLKITQNVARLFLEYYSHLKYRR